MPILTLINVQYLQIVLFNIEKDLNGQKHSSSDFHTIQWWKVQGFKKIKKIENNIIKDIRNLFRLKKEIGDTTVKDVSNCFRLKKKNGWYQY